MYGKASTETARKIVSITSNASPVRLPINTGTVHLHIMSTTSMDRWPSNARIMALSLEWEVPTVSEIKIAGKMLNLLKLLEWMWSLCLKFVFKCYPHDDHIDDKRDEQATWHRASS